MKAMRPMTAKTVTIETPKTTQYWTLPGAKERLKCREKKTETNVWPHFRPSNFTKKAIVAAVIKSWKSGSYPP